MWLHIPVFFIYLFLVSVWLKKDADLWAEEGGGTQTHSTTESHVLLIAPHCYRGTGSEISKRVQNTDSCCFCFREFLCGHGITLTGWFPMINIKERHGGVLGVSSCCRESPPPRPRPTPCPPPDLPISPHCLPSTCVAELSSLMLKVTIPQNFLKKTLVTRVSVALLEFSVCHSIRIQNQLQHAIPKVAVQPVHKSETKTHPVQIYSLYFTLSHLKITFYLVVLTVSMKILVSCLIVSASLLILNALEIHSFCLGAILWNGSLGRGVILMV